MSPSAVHTATYVTLRDERTFGYAEYGDPTGTPVVFFNGSASRLFYHRDDARDRDAHARTDHYGGSPRYWPLDLQTPAHATGLAG